MMSGYILSILGVVVAGILIDIIMPSGTINKYIKSIYSIFIVAVIISPIIKFITNNKDFKFDYNEYQISEKLLEYIYNKQVDEQEKNIEILLSNEGFSNIDININFSIENNEIIYKNCDINLKNMVIDSDKQHINSYEYIKEVVSKQLNLKSEEIVMDG